MCGVSCNEKQEKELKKLGVKDSKLLSLKQREELFEKVKKAVNDFKIIEVYPEEIDDLIASGTNLNSIEAIHSAKIINSLQGSRAILDCPSPNIKAYKQEVFEMIERKIEVIAEHKADMKYVSVGAASILAKVTRDRRIEKMKKDIGINFGSGYLSDPLTKKFLHKNFDKFPDILRKSWKPYKDLVFKQNQSSLSEF